MRRCGLEVAIVMRREPVASPMRHWQASRWMLEDVVAHQPVFGSAARLLLRDGPVERWLFPQYPVDLYADDAEGYYLNATSPAPCWFVMWRAAAEHPAADGAGDGPGAVPVAVSLSYHDAGRWLDAQETVEQVPAAVAVVDWLSGFVAAHYRPERKQRRRPSSFRAPADRHAGRPWR